MDAEYFPLLCRDLQGPILSQETHFLSELSMVGGSYPGPRYALGMASAVQQ